MVSVSMGSLVIQKGHGFNELSQMLTKQYG